jgi:nucleoside-diphosphate-sugar epimerase
MPLVRMLCDAGHEVIAIHRAPSGHDRLLAAGAVPVQADVLDGTRLAQALAGMSADAVISELTSLKKAPLRHSDMTGTNQLRVAGTANLLAAAHQVGARRFITQSIVLGYGFGDWGGRVLTEADPFAPPGRGQFEEHLAALRACESAVLGTAGIEGIALRYGFFYGPGPGCDALVTALRRRQVTLTLASGVLPWVYIEDAAAATLAALEHGSPGSAYNIADDEPVSTSALYTAIAEAVGAPRPLSIPGWLVTAAPYAKSLIAGGLRVSSDKAKAELGWKPQVPTYRTGMQLLASYYKPTPPLPVACSAAAVTPVHAGRVTPGGRAARSSRLLGIGRDGAARLLVDIRRNSGRTPSRIPARHQM